MSEINEKDSPKKTNEQEATTAPAASPFHDNAAASSSARTDSADRHEGINDGHDSTASSGKLYDSISFDDHRAANKQLWDNIYSSANAAEMLALNPLGDQSAEAPENFQGHRAGTAVADRFQFDSSAPSFSDFLNYGEDKLGSIGSLNGVWKDIFNDKNNRQVDNLEQMGLPSLGIFTPTQRTSLSFGLDGTEAGRRSNDLFDSSNVDLGDALTASFMAPASRWDSAADQTISDKLSNVTVNWDGSPAPEADAKSESGARTELHQTKGGRVETTIEADKTIVQTPEDKITQSHADANGRHDTTINTKDGRSLHQDTNGERTATNKNSDIVIKEDPKTGKVEALDKSGKEVAEFNNKGDATRFFDNAIAQVVQPPQSLDDAYKAMQKDHPDQLKSEPVLLMDGKGESLVIRPDGSTLRTHANGDAEATYKHTGHDGREHDLQVNVVEGKDGQDHVTIGHVGGKQYELNSAEAARIMEHFGRFRLSEHGHLMINQDGSGDPARNRWQHFVNRHHQIESFKGGTINLRTGQATIDDDKTHALITPNKTTGVSTMTEASRHPDGTVDAFPSRVTTMDHGKISTQGEDPTTGQLNPNDLVSYNSATGDLNAWNINMTPDNCNVMNDDGSFTDLNNLGDFSSFDANGDPIADSKDDQVSYDNSDSYETATQAQSEENAREDYTDDVEDATSDIAQAAQTISSTLAVPDLNPGQLSALESSLDAAIAECAKLGIPIPTQVSTAQVQLANMRAKLAEHQKTKDGTAAQV